MLQPKDRKLQQCDVSSGAVLLSWPEQWAASSARPRLEPYEGADASGSGSATHAPWPSSRPARAWCDAQFKGSLLTRAATELLRFSLRIEIPSQLPGHCRTLATAPRMQFAHVRPYPTPALVSGE